MESIDEHFVRAVHARSDAGRGAVPADQLPMLQRLFDAQVQSRHLDFAARWLQKQGKGYYTIGSAGHESNAARRPAVPGRPIPRCSTTGPVASTRPEPPSPAADNPVRDVLLSLTSATSDPMSGGRHKVFGHPGLGIIPQTSTIGSHLPRAVGLGYSLDLARARRPRDSVARGRDRGVQLRRCVREPLDGRRRPQRGRLPARTAASACPVLFVCEDNGIGISTRTPGGLDGGRARSAFPGSATGTRTAPTPSSLLAVVAESLAAVRDEPAPRCPAPAHRPVHGSRRLGRRESRTGRRREILADYARDPLLGDGARAGRCRRHVVVRRPRSLRGHVRQRRDGRGQAGARRGSPSTQGRRHGAARPAASPADDPGRALPSSSARAALGRPPARGRAADDAGADHQRHPHRPDGRPARARWSSARTSPSRAASTASPAACASGSAASGCSTPCSTSRPSSASRSARRWPGFVPIPEIQYLAYLHNAEDQLRGEAATLRFFSNGQYQNGMVVRIAGLRLPARLRRTLPQRQLGGGAARHPRARARRAEPPRRRARPAAHLLLPGPAGRPCLRLPRADRAVPHPGPPRGGRRRVDRRLRRARSGPRRSSAWARSACTATAATSSSSRSATAST